MKHYGNNLRTQAELVTATVTHSRLNELFGGGDVDENIAIDILLAQCSASVFIDSKKGVDCLNTVACSLLVLKDESEREKTVMVVFLIS